MQLVWDYLRAGAPKGLYTNGENRSEVESVMKLKRDVVSRHLYTSNTGNLSHPCKKSKQTLKAMWPDLLTTR